jgi:hypothetical protein
MQLKGDGACIWSEGSTERARIDDSGRLLVGTSTARSNVNSTAPNLQIETATTVGTAAASLSVINNQGAGASTAAINLGLTRGTSLGGTTKVESTDELGYINFLGSDGTSFIPAARIFCAVDSTTGANDMPGRLVFSTTADGASSPTVAVRIDSRQRLIVPELPGPSRLTDYIAAFNGSANRGIACLTNTAGTRFHIDFYNNITASSEQLCGTISTAGSSTTYATTSDYRLKENVVPLTDAIDRVNQLQVHRFNFIADPDKTVDGFIAHEAQAVVPECVTGTKDEVDKDGNPVYQGIDQSKLVPLLAAALQEALAEIKSLKARVTALEP